MKAKVTALALVILILIGVGALLCLKTAKVERVPLWVEGFEKYEGNPIIKPSGYGFDADLTFNPGVIYDKDNGVFYMLYRAINLEEKPTDGCWATSSIGLAMSYDGINFERYDTYDTPVIYPEFDYEMQGGCEDPRLVKIGDTYYVTYTGYSPEGTPSCLASSKDLIHWEKYGPITPAKSATILNTSIDGKYWLYFGDTDIWAACSTDLIHWNVVEDPVIEPREGYFDEALVEPGPPPILTGDGILLIYNGNIPEERARELGKGMVRQYCTGWALFSAEDPTKLIARCDEPFLKPTKDFERYGEVNDVVFAEGLVNQFGRWYLYYGCADTRIGVAIADETLLAETLSKISQPILMPKGKGFESERVYNPTTIAADDRIAMIYRAEPGTDKNSCLGLAFSSDGISFERYERNPILVPDEVYDYFCEDPKVVKFGETYYLIYGGGEPSYVKQTPGNIRLATSKDLIHWEKHGEILQPKYEWESGQIKAGVIVPQKINGKYWMYYQGEVKPWHTAMGLAYSEDLLQWNQLDRPVMEPRKDSWDSQGTEPGCAVVLPEGILVIYNGWDETTQNKGGWALFSKEDPSKLIARCDSPIVSLPDKHVFVTALVQFRDKWYLYWGANDEWINGAGVDLKALFPELNMGKHKLEMGTVPVLQRA
jgi:predicted GH43/DUF377 family glycosyl hydrolase